jgi:serine/threonine protein kinase
MPASSAPPSPSSALLALSGTVIDARYELGRIIGAGGMGAVFEAKHLRLGRMVAIKVLRPDFADHDEYVQRFLREAQAVSRIRHRNVVEIHDYGEAPGGLVYSVMELLRGQDLDQYLASRPHQRLPWWEASSLLAQAARGLKAAHAAGIVHRDVKPANCFLADEEGQPLLKIVDFGIAKAQGTEQTRLTATSVVLGTPGYVAPELALTSHPASPRSDMYSLGVVAYRMLAGRIPFTGATPYQVLQAACFEPVPPLRAFAPDVPPGVEALVMQMLAKAPEDRPSDMQAVRDALALLDGARSVSQAVEITPAPTQPFESTVRMGPTLDGAVHAPSNAPRTEILHMEPPPGPSSGTVETTRPPQSTALVHALAFLYLTMGEATDDNLTPDEMRTLADRLHRRAPDLSLEHLGQVLRQTVQAYKEASTREERLRRALQYASSLRTTLDVAARRAILDDLRAVAEADRVVLSEELGFFSAVTRMLGLDPEGRGTA